MSSVSENGDCDLNRVKFTTFKKTYRERIFLLNHFQVQGHGVSVWFVLHAERVVFGVEQL